MKRKIFTLLMSSLFVSATFAQWTQPEGVIMKAGDVIPVIDGVNTNDAEYLNAEVYNIDRQFVLDAPRVATLGEPGETNWRAVYSEEGDKAGIYILITVVDDVYLPHYISGGANSWQFDHLELYFDTNYEKVDGMGGHSDNIATGHAQIAPDYTAAKEDGTVSNYGGATGIAGTWAFKLDNPNVTAEYFVPFKQMKTNEGTLVDLFGSVGFDVTVIDRDGTEGDAESDRKRMVWSNDATGVAANESWNNMDEAGLITFFEPNQVIFVESIAVEGGSITENNGTLQLVATVLPAEASNKELTWSLENVTGSAAISPSGMLTGKTNGTVKLIAKATDGSYVESEPVEITISNQIVTLTDISILMNGDFNEVEGDGRGKYWTNGWTDASPAHQVVDGVSVHNVVIPAVDPQVWRYQFVNTDFVTEPNVDYNLDFKAWADVETMVNLDFEDTPANNYTRYGASTDATSNGRSEWNVQLLTEATDFMLNVNFDQKVPTTDDKLTFMLGNSGSPLYIDSVFLYKESDLEKLTPDYVPVKTINVTAAGMQMSAEILPATATLGGVKWSILPGTGTATVDAAGMVSGVTAGTVTVVATAKDDSNVKGMFEITVVAEVGIAPNRIGSVKVYPSIASDFINIETTSSNAVATIYNSVGRKVSQAIAGQPVNVSKLAAGVYFVKVNNVVTKFIKK